MQTFPGFVCEDVRLAGPDDKAEIQVRWAAHQGRPRLCSECHEPSPGYDRQRERRWRHVPLWTLLAVFIYAPRRVTCATHGVIVEHMPWNVGKRPWTRAMMGLLARWARRLSWGETARVFETSWEAVYRSVAFYVDWGLQHRVLKDVHAIAVDDLHWGKGKGPDRFLTIIFQIDQGFRRVLWVGRRRTMATLRRGFQELGPEVVRGLRFVCSDMWRPYLAVLAEMVGHALQIIDRFHIDQHLNQAVDEVRRAECVRLKGQARGKWLKGMRWKLLRRGTRVRGLAKLALLRLFRANQATGQAWMHKEAFRRFWGYRSVRHAAAFLDVWCARALRSRLEPIGKVARMLRSHRELILNWFDAKGQISSAVAEGLNNKIRVVTRRSYGFRQYRAMELAIYHTLGKLPEPDVTHRFC